MKRILMISIVAAVVGTVLLFSFGCTQPENPRAKITIVGEDGEPVEGARVVVRAPSADSSHTMIYLESGPRPVADTSWTGRDGIVSYRFKYEAIYRVEVTKGGDNNFPFTRRGLGVLILENDKTYETEITINEQTVFN